MYVPALLDGFEMQFEIDYNGSITDPLRIFNRDASNRIAPPNTPIPTENLYVTINPPGYELLGLLEYNSIDSEINATINIVPPTSNNNNIFLRVNSRSIFEQMDICDLVLDNGNSYNLKLDDLHEIEYFIDENQFAKASLNVVFTPPDALITSVIENGFELYFESNGQNNINGPIKIYDNIGVNIPAPPNVPFSDYLYVTLNSIDNELEEFIEYHNIDDTFTANLNVSLPNGNNNVVLRVNSDSIASKTEMCELIVDNGKIFDLRAENFCKIDYNSNTTIILNVKFTSLPEQRPIIVPGFEMNFEHVDGQVSITNPIIINLGNNSNVPAPPNAPDISGSEYLYVSLLPDDDSTPLVEYNTVRTTFSSTINIIPNGTGIVGDHGHVNVIVDSENIAMKTSICKLTLSDNWEGLEYDLRTKDIHEIPFYAGLGIRLDVQFISGFDIAFYSNNKESILGPLKNKEKYIYEYTSSSKYARTQ